MSALDNPEIYQTVLSGLQTGVCLVDRDRKIVFWNDGAERITGYLRHEVVGRTCHESVLAPCDRKACDLCGASCPLSEVMHEGTAREAHIYLCHKMGHQVLVHLRVTPIRSLHASIVGAAASFDEQSPDRHARSLSAYGFVDLATGIPNHKFTQSHLRESLATFTEYRVPFGILRIQVDELDQFQAKHGRYAAELILHATAETIEGILGSAGFLGRWADNEFLAIVPGCDGEELERLDADIQKVVSSSAIRWWDNHLSVSVSVGRTMVQSGDTMESLLERANLVLGRPRRKSHSQPGTPQGPGDSNRPFWNRTENGVGSEWGGR